MFADLSTDSFWTVNVGHLITIGALLISFWSAHISNIRRIEKDARDRQDMKTKLDMIYEWFVKTIVRGHD